MSKRKFWIGIAVAMPYPQNDHAVHARRFSVPGHNTKSNPYTEIFTPFYPKRYTGRGKHVPTLRGLPEYLVLWMKKGPNRPKQFPPIT